LRCASRHTLLPIALVSEFRVLKLEAASIFTSTTDVPVFPVTLSVIVSVTL
jgi:hypothetical protein